MMRLCIMLCMYWKPLPIFYIYVKDLQAAWCLGYIMYAL